MNNNNDAHRVIKTFCECKIVYDYYDRVFRIEYICDKHAKIKLDRCISSQDFMDEILK